MINSVLAGGGATAALLLLELELELLLLELELLLELDFDVPHGSTATVCVRALVGIVTTFDPGGILLDPDCTVAASEHEVIASVNGLCCLGMTMVRTPGVCSALDTGFTLELELELLLELLLPQPASASIPAHEMDAVAKTPARFIFPPAWLTRRLRFEGASCAGGASYTSPLTLPRPLLTLRFPWCWKTGSCLPDADGQVGVRRSHPHLKLLMVQVVADRNGLARATGRGPLGLGNLTVA